MGKKKLATGALVVAASIGATALAVKHHRKQKHHRDHEDIQDLRDCDAGGRRGWQASRLRNRREQYGAEHHLSYEREDVYEAEYSYDQPHYSQGYCQEDDGPVYAQYQLNSASEKCGPYTSSSRSSTPPEHTHTQAVSSDVAEPSTKPAETSQELVLYESDVPSPVEQAQYAWAWDAKKKKRYFDSHDGQHRVYVDGERHRLKPLPPPEAMPGPEFKFDEYNGLRYWPNEAEKCWIYEDGTRQEFS